MKRILLVIGFWLAALPLWSQGSHNFGIQVTGGYSDMIGLKGADTHGGAKIEAGVLYEWHKNHFLFQVGVGVDYAYQGVKNTPVTGAIPGMIDTDNDECIYHYSIHDKRDHMQRLAVNPRISVGGQWGDWYFLVGAGAQVHLMSSSASQALLNTSGEYERLIVPLEGMENHSFLVDYPLSDQRGLQNNIDLTVHGEVGYQLPSMNRRSVRSIEPVHRIALFVECGIVSFNNPTVSQPVADLRLQTNRIDDIDFDQVAIRPLIGSDQLAWREVHPMTIGVRWTMLLTTPSSEKCNCLKE